MLRRCVVQILLQLYETFAILFQFKNLKQIRQQAQSIEALQLSKSLLKATLQTRVAVENSQFKIRFHHLM